MLYYSQTFLFTLFQLALCAPGSPTTSTPPSHTTSCTAPLPTFILKLQKPEITFNNVKLDGTYGQLDTGDGPLVGFNGANRTDAVVLSLNAEGNILIDELDIIGYQDPGQTEELLHFESAEEVQASGGIPAVCDVSSGVLKCAAAAGNTHLVLCPGDAVTNDLFLVNVIKPECVEPKLKVLHVK